MCKRAPNDGGALRGRCHTGAGRRSPLKIAEPASGVVAYYVRTVQLASRVGFYVLNVIIFPSHFRSRDSSMWQWPPNTIIFRFARASTPHPSPPTTNARTRITDERCCLRSAECPRLGRVYTRAGRVWEEAKDAAAIIRMSPNRWKNEDYIILHRLGYACCIPPDERFSRAQ